jgi:hypothetical protein
MYACPNTCTVNPFARKLITRKKSKCKQKGETSREVSMYLAIQFKFS